MMRHLFLVEDRRGIRNGAGELRDDFAPVRFPCCDDFVCAWMGGMRLVQIKRIEGLVHHNGSGTNPEELIGAALAGCFSMALSANLEKAGHPATRVHTTANVKLDTVEGGPKITTIQLENESEVPGIDEQTFRQQAEKTKSGC